MKIKFLKFCLLSNMLFLSGFVFGQNIGFSYDATGNRTDRYVIREELKTTLSDSILPDYNVPPIDAKLFVQEVYIYPNPTTDEIQIHCVETEDDFSGKAFLFSSNGKLLTSFIINKSDETFRMEKYLPGIYFLKLRINSIVKTWKIVKN